MTYTRQKRKYLAATQQMLVASQEEKEAYTVEILGKTFDVLPGVFSPKYFSDTCFFAEVFPDPKDKKVLEIGPGTGVVSIFAALRGAAHVTAIDINPAAVANTTHNAKRHCVVDKLTILQGDVYRPLQLADQFDIIFWNTPFGLVHDRPLTNLERSVFDVEYQATARFITGAQQHLRPGGMLLIGFSSTLGHPQLLRQLLTSAGFQIQQIQARRSREVYPVNFELMIVQA